MRSAYPLIPRVERHHALLEALCLAGQRPRTAAALAEDDRGQPGQGFMMPVYTINETTLRQSRLEDHMLGRMSATSSFLFHGVVPVGALLGGALASLIGLQQTLFLSAAGAFAGVVWFAPSWMRRLR